jgi:16S rRNA (guanine527-N7)-methyltransferase
MFDDMFQKTLESGLYRSGIQLSEVQVHLLVRHAAELLKWNKKINLTAITQPREMVEKHYIDSMIGTRALGLTGKFIDIGSGGGFPGIPLKILYPNLNLVLLDASRKKISFLKHVIRTLGLTNIDAVHARAEDICRDPSFNQQFDGVISRAFSRLDQFVMTGQPFLSSNGFLLALKGKNYQKELDMIQVDLFQITVDTYTLPFTGADRFMIKIRPCH